MTDTTSNALDSIKPAFESVREAQSQADKAISRSRSAGNHNRANRLQRCVSNANQDVNALQRCVQRFGP